MEVVRNPRGVLLVLIVVMVGAGSVVLAGAVLTAEGGPVVIGADCVVMENEFARYNSAFLLQARKCGL